MKWLFTILTVAIELTLGYLLFEYVDFYPAFMLFAFGMVAGIFVKSTNLNNSPIRNQIAFGLFIGTVVSIIITVTSVLWLLSRLT